MYELFIGNYEKVIGREVCYKSGENYISGIVTYYDFKSRKYTIVLKNNKTIKTEKIYIKQKEQ